MVVTNRLIKHYRFSNIFAFINRNVRSRRKKIKQIKNLYESIGLEDSGCSLCGSKEFKLISNSDRYGFNLSKQFCNSCGLIQTYPRLSKEFHDIFYASLYRPLYLKRHKVDYEDLMIEQTNKGKKYLEFFCKNIGEENLKSINYIEIGCSSGGTLNYLSESFKSSVGCDLDQEAIKFANKKFDNKFELGLYPEGIPKGKKLFLISHALEHVYSPLETLSDIRSKMDEGDFLFVAVPGIRMVKKGDYKNDLRRYFHIAHVTDFEKSTLENVASLAGFQSIEIDEEINALFRASKKSKSFLKVDPSNTILSIEATYKGKFPHL